MSEEPRIGSKTEQEWFEKIEKMFMPSLMECAPITLFKEAEERLRKAREDLFKREHPFKYFWSKIRAKIR